MKITRFHRAMILIGMMIITSLYLWLTWSSHKLFCFEEILSLAIMFTGVGVCVYSMRYGLKHVLSSAVFTIGLYTIVKSFTLEPWEESFTIIVAACFIFVGFIAMALGISIWLGYKFNIVRVRMCMIIIAAACFLTLIAEARMNMDFALWWEDAHFYIMVMLLSSTFAFVTLDPSMELPSIVNGVQDDIKAKKRRLICTRDAYILTSDSESIQHYLESNIDEPIEILVRSQEFISFRLIIEKDMDGKVLKIRDLDRIFMPVLFTMRFNELITSADHITFFGDDGHFVRLIVLDEVQENMNLPKIFGRELNLSKIKK